MNNITNEIAIPKPSKVKRTTNICSNEQTLKQNCFDPFKNSPNTNFLTNLVSRMEHYNGSVDSSSSTDKILVNLNMEYLR